MSPKTALGIASFTPNIQQYSDGHMGFAGGLATIPAMIVGLVLFFYWLYGYAPKDPWFLLALPLWLAIYIPTRFLEKSAFREYPEYFKETIFNRY